MNARETLDGIRTRLAAATDHELELAGTEPSMSGQHFSIRRKGVPGLRISGHEYGHGGSYTELLLHAPTDIARLTAALEAVLGLHNPIPCEPECCNGQLCETCIHDWPCPTVAAIENVLTD